MISLLSPHSFSRGRRCKRRGPPFQAITLPFGPRLRPTQQRSTTPISPSWWPWLPCPFLPHRQRSTTSIRSDGTRLQTGITLHLLYLDCVFTSGCLNVLDFVYCVVYVQFEFCPVNVLFAIIFHSFVMWFYSTVTVLLHMWGLLNSTQSSPLDPVPSMLDPVQGTSLHLMVSLAPSFPPSRSPVDCCLLSHVVCCSLLVLMWFAFYCVNVVQ